MRKKFLLMMTLVLIFATGGGKLEAQKFENQNVTNESKPKAALADEGDVTLDADIDVATQTEIPAESVAQIGENAYPTLQAAFEAAAQATEATTITLLSNITIESDLNNAAWGYFNVADGKNVTLDLGGKKITATDNSTGNFILFYNYGEFTIKNGTVDLTATNNRLWNAESAIVLNRGGIFNCESGTYTHKGGSDMSFVFDNSGNYYGDATMNIGVQQRSTDAPVLTSSYISIRNRMEQNSHGASGTTYLNVYGGTISGTSRAVWAQAASVSETAPATGVINIKGGSIGLIDTPRSTGAESMTTISGGTVAAFKGEVGELQVVAPGEITGEITILTPGGESADYIIDENGNYIEPTIVEVGSQDALQSAINDSQSGELIKVTANIELTSSITIPTDKYIILDLNGKNLTGGANVNLYIKGELTIEDNVGNAVSTFRNHYVSNGGKLTLKSGILQNIETNTGGYGIFIDEEGESTIEGGTVQAVNESNYAICVKGRLTIDNGNIVGKHGVIAVENQNAIVTIKDGEYTLNAITGNSDHIVYVTAGMVNIEGGNFTFNNFIANGGDSMIYAAEENVSITGGTYTQDVNEWCAEGYAALPDLNGNYIVGVKPTATVNNLGMTTVAAGDYMVYGSGTNTEDMPLSFVMQFLADQDAEDMATSPFADWYGDFVITFTGLENGSFTADGCYLAGHYGDFGWVKVPVDGMTIEEGERYPVMLGVGMGQKYDYICSGVQDFKCALYLTDGILEANPNIKVNLELAIVDNSQDEDAAASALVENENVYKVVDYNYDAIDFNKDYVARIGNAGYTTLAAAVEAATEGQTIVLLQNIDLTESLTVEADQTVILDLNGKKINYNSTTQGEAMITITNRGNLTINDSGNTGEIYYNYTGAADPTYGKGNYTISNGGTLTVNGGKIHIADLRAHAKYPIDNNSTSGDAILVINGGHLYNYNTSAIRQFCNSTKNKNSVTINGGLIEGYCAIWMQNPGKKTVNGQLAITGGEIEIRTTASAYVNGTSDIDEVNSRIYCTIDGEGGAWDESSAVAITGGTINENVYLGEESPASMRLYKEAQFNGYVEFDLSEGRELVHNGLSNVTVTKNITRHPVPEDNNEYVGGWYTISSPVGTVGHNKVDGLLNGTHDLYRYNEETMIWENVKDATNEGFTTLESGRGYLYANTADTELSFTGNLVAESVAQAITVTDNNLKGFNLIGNPFTYNITMSNMSGASLAEGFYTLSNHGAWQPNAKTATIAPMQGALIKATETTANFTIAPNSAKRSESENKGQIKIEVSNDNYNDVAYVSFNEGIGLDKIEHRNANIPMVYVPVDGINYAIATMSQDVTEVPVSFRAMTMGQYTIGAEAQDCEYAMMTLVDRLTGTETNLLLEDYTFVATTKDNADRFIIKLAKINADGENEDNFAFINNGMMYIYNIEGQGMVSIYDVTGRPVAEFNVETSANIPTSELSTGIYIIRMTDNNGVKVQKILID